MLTPAVILGFIAIVELALGIGLLTFVFNLFQNAGWPARRKQAAFVASGVLLISPAAAPAGMLAVVPLPLGMMLAFIRSAADAAFLLHTWWVIVPSMVITGIACTYVARRIFLEGYKK